MMNFIRKYFPEVLLFSVSLFLMFYRLGGTALTNWDEAWYAALARDMVEHRRPLDPHYNGISWFAAAPLYPWLVALWFGLFGRSELGVRFFSAAAGLGSVWLVYLIGRRLGGRTVGLAAGTVLVTTIQFLYRARTGNLDATLTFFIALAVYAGIKGQAAVAGAATGLAVLTKGPWGLLGWPALLAGRKKASWRSLVTGAVLLALPWHLMMTLRYGRSFIDGYLDQYIWGKLRLINPVSGSSPWWYGGVLRHGLKAWSIPALGALLLIGFSRKQRRSFVVPLVWAATVLTAVTLVSTKNSWYILPIYPAVSLIIAGAVLRLGRIFPWRLIWGGVLVVVGFQLVCYWDQFVVPDTTRAEAALARAAGELAGEEDGLLLDDSYHPVAVYYSGRPVTILRFGRGDEVVPVGSANQWLSGSRRWWVLTNVETWPELRVSLGAPETRSVMSEGDKMLVEVWWPNN